jgi:hypothetical protein
VGLRNNTYKGYREKLIETALAYARLKVFNSRLDDNQPAPCERFAPPTSKLGGIH